MPPTLKALLKKPELTSRDAGLILMYCAKATLEDKEDTLPITTADLNAIIASTRYRSDRHRFETFEAFYNAIREHRERAYDNARRLAGGINLLNLYMRIFNDHSKQDTLRFKLPLTLTHYGYQFYTAATKTAAEKRTFEFYDILSYYLFFYYRLYAQGEALMLSHSLLNGYTQAETQLITEKSIKEMYKQTHHENKIIDREHPEGYNLDFDQTGDYLLKTIKAQKLTKYETEKFLAKLDEIDRLYYLDDIDGMREAMPSLIEYGFITEAELQKAMEGDLKEWYATIANEYDNCERVPTHFIIDFVHKEMPAGTTIGTLLQEANQVYLDANSYPTGILFTNDTRSHTKQIRELKKNAPALFEALCDQIRHDIPQFKELDNSEIIKATIKGQDLKELQNDVMRDKFENVNFVEIREFITNSKYTSYLEKRQAENGIAMYSLMEKEHETYISRLYHKGKTYTPPMPEIHPTIQEFKELDLNRTYLKEIFTPLKMVFAYNTFIDICTDVLNIPFMNHCAKLKEIPLLQMAIKNCNDNLYTTYRCIDGSPEDKKLRRELFNQAFKRIDPSTAYPNQNCINAFKGFFEKAIKEKHGAAWIRCAATTIAELANSSDI